MLNEQKTTMTSSNRPPQRFPSRTPPFVLIGLLVILSFLGYSYWSLSSSNSDLSSQLKAIGVEKRDTETKHMEIQKVLTDTKSQISALQTESMQLKKDLQAKDAEVQALKADVAQKVLDNEKEKTMMEQCDEKLSLVQKDLENSNIEKSNLQKSLEEERKKVPDCKMEACFKPLQDVLVLASNLIGSEKMHKALADAGLPADTLMSGINVPPPAAEKLPEHLKPFIPDVASGPKEEVRAEQQTNTKDKPTDTNSETTQVMQANEAKEDKPQGGNLNMAFDTRAQEVHNQGEDDNGSFPGDASAQDEEDDMNEDVDPDVAIEFADAFRDKGQMDPSTWGNVGLAQRESQEKEGNFGGLEYPADSKTPEEEAAIMKYGVPIQESTENGQARFDGSHKQVPSQSEEGQAIFNRRDDQMNSRFQEKQAVFNIDTEKNERPIDDMHSASDNFFHRGNTEESIMKGDVSKNKGYRQNLDDVGAMADRPYVLTFGNQKEAVENQP